ncbi:STAS domain-containing protein [Mycobacterium sp. EPa45]|uniref:STAS domain-containing protein n=1 Tax=Mycobacterium sp. EPa45 TaxID=1545728 RepID=UPI0006992E6A|nr:STAS domain-containing protein [Mycobacterium sp. EPa45]
MLRSISSSTACPPTNRLQLSTEWSSPTEVRITAVGDVDMSTADQFTDYVFRGAGNCLRLVLDMTQVTFFDCAGLSALYCIEDRCHAADVTLDLEPAHCVSRVMTLCESLCA